MAKAKMIGQGSEIQPRIICTDVIDGLHQIEAESVQLIFADPPSNIGVYCGSGSMLRVCRKHSRKFIGIDNNAEYCRRMAGDDHG